MQTKCNNKFIHTQIYIYNTHTQGLRIDIGSYNILLCDGNGEEGWLKKGGN